MRTPAHSIESTLQGATTGAIGPIILRSRKGALIAQEEEEGCLIWGSQQRSGLQPHGALINTPAPERERLIE